MMVMTLSTLEVQRWRRLSGLNHLHNTVLLRQHFHGRRHVSGSGHAFGALASQRRPLSRCPTLDRKPELFGHLWAQRLLVWTENKVLLIRLEEWTNEKLNWIKVFQQKSNLNLIYFSLKAILTQSNRVNRNSNNALNATSYVTE